LCHLRYARSIAVRQPEQRRLPLIISRSTISWPKAHTTQFAEGSQGEYVFTVRKGLVKLVRYQSDGSQRIIRLVGPGDIAGLETTANASYDSTAIAVTEVQACRIPLGVIQRLENESPRLHQQLVRKWHEALKTADDIIADLSSGNARQRLARLLLRLVGSDDNGQLMLPPREDVGGAGHHHRNCQPHRRRAFRREGMLIDMDRQGRFFFASTRPPLHAAGQRRRVSSAAARSLLAAWDDGSTLDPAHSR
jgi:CRP-like cAMP-binding protein